MIMLPLKAMDGLTCFEPTSAEVGDPYQSPIGILGQKCLEIIILFTLTEVGLNP